MVVSVLPSDADLHHYVAYGTEQSPNAYADLNAMTSTTSKPCGYIMRSAQENWKPPLTENRVDLYFSQLPAVTYGDIYT